MVGETRVELARQKAAGFRPATSTVPSLPRKAKKYQGVKRLINSNNYSIEDINRVASEVKSMAAFLRGLGLVPSGGNYINMKRLLQNLQTDTEHWTGQAWNRDQQQKDFSDYKRASSAKPYLIKERGHACESCGLDTWLEFPIVLELHHIDGDRTHNEAENLQLLCPNCHSTTDNWRNRKRN